MRNKQIACVTRFVIQEKPHFMASLIENSCVSITPSICQRPLAGNLIMIPCIAHEMNFFVRFCSPNVSIVATRDKENAFVIISVLPRCKGMQSCCVHPFGPLDTPRLHKLRAKEQFKIGSNSTQILQLRILQFLLPPPEAVITST